MMIFHVTARDDWRPAETKGSYELSTRGKTLAEVGFIHCSRADQVTQVANVIYRGEHGLVLLVIDRDRVTSPIRDEPANVGAERFPHIYGPLNLDAVVEVLPFEPEADGTFILPELPAHHGKPSQAKKAADQPVKDCARAPRVS